VSLRETIASARISPSAPEPAHRKFIPPEMTGLMAGAMRLAATLGLLAV